MQVQKKMLHKAMTMAGVTRITPEMARHFTLAEKIAAGMGAYFSLRGAFFTILSVVGFYAMGLKAYHLLIPKEVVTDLNEVVNLERSSPVDVEINVDFDEAIKVWTVKKRYFVTPVKGYEGKLFFFRSESHLEGEGKVKPIRVQGWAGKSEWLGWDVPGLDSRADERFAGAGMDIPSDAEILYESDPEKGSMIQGVIYTVVALVMVLVVWFFLNRVIRTMKMLGDATSLADGLNERLGFDD